MFKSLRQWAFTAVFLLLIVGLSVVGGAWLHFRFIQSRYEALLERQNTQLREEKQILTKMVDRLSRSHRLAQIVVTDQTPEETSLLLVELDDSGNPLSRQCITIPGDIAYFDGLVVKFSPDSVAQGHPLRGRSIALLRRVYSENQSPQDGFNLDHAGDIPPGYRLVGETGIDKSSDSTLTDTADKAQFEKRIWSQFWAIANDSALANELGVRVAQGEAVYKPMKPGVLYELTIDAVGGLNLETKPLPEAVAEVLAAAVVNESPDSRPPN